MNNPFGKDAFTYLTVEQESHAEFIDRGSKFIAYAFPLSSEEAFKDRLKGLTREHPKAVHHCFAYRIGLEGIRFRSGDDGEPAGSAGKPILGQIDSRGLTDTAVIVVRYFGGTLLGVPGLINAYKNAAALALQVARAVEKSIEDQYDLEFDYTLVNEVMMVIKRHSCSVLKQEMQLFCHFRVGIPRRSRDACLRQFGNIHGVSVNATRP